ncbi:hypothetical protein VNO77_12648 [Canavalia gladiata]|uniref:Uncharacterized protein n=1 Tax=Canavalia gladiata TaxID=3824 RepID=A0AAN9LX08_CANGL
MHTSHTSPGECTDVEILIGLPIDGTSTNGNASSPRFLAQFVQPLLGVPLSFMEDLHGSDVSMSNMSGLLQGDGTGPLDYFSPHDTSSSKGYESSIFNAKALNSTEVHNYVLSLCIIVADDLYDHPIY